MSLTPLRYDRRPDGRPIYGHPVYFTRCGRFVLLRDDDRRWVLDSTTYDEPGLTWYAWLCAVGLYPAVFERRRDCLTALITALTQYDLLDAPVPGEYPGTNDHM